MAIINLGFPLVADTATEPLPVSPPCGYCAQVQSVSIVRHYRRGNMLVFDMLILDGPDEGAQGKYYITLDRPDVLRAFAIATGGINMGKLVFDDQAWVGAVVRMIVIKKELAKGEEDKGHTRVTRVLHPSYEKQPSARLVPTKKEAILAEKFKL